MKKFLLLFLLSFLVSSSVFARSTGCKEGNCENGYGKWIYTDKTTYEGEWVGTKKKWQRGRNLAKRLHQKRRIKIADFYYKKSAKNMSNKIKSEIKLKNIKIIELTKTNYRLLLGPFNDIQSLKDSFEKMNSLYFENLEIIKDA